MKRRKVAGNLPHTLRPVTFRIAAPGYLNRKYAGDPREIVLHGECEHDKQPEKARNGGKPDQVFAPPDVHEIEHDERHFGEGDHKREQRVRTRKNAVKIPLRSNVGQDRTYDEYCKNAQISRYRNMSFARFYVFI